MLTRVVADGPPVVEHPLVFLIVSFLFALVATLWFAEAQCSPGAVVHVSAQAALLSMYCIAMSAAVLAC